MNINPAYIGSVIKGVFLSLFCLLPFHASALQPDFYAENSALATGNWAKIEVSETGMQFVSNTVLRNLGFTDPSKVNVYGFGGRMLSEKLNEEMPDDLPVVPSIQTPTGIIFFGFGSTGWTFEGQNTEYRHINNPYSDHSYYFLSDKDGERTEATLKGAITATSGQPLTIFTERISHEQDLLAPSNTGRLMLGEDFKAQNNRSFKFSLPDNTGDATVTVSFGAKSTGGSSIVMSANGETLPATKNDQISAAGSSKFIVTTTSTKVVDQPGDNLNLLINFSGSGSVSVAALDYIEVEYPRLLKLNNGELYFYLNPDRASEVNIADCSDATVIWDVTDPLNIKEVPSSLAGSTLSFAAPAGYSEYVAFNPTSIKRVATAAGRIANQDIHGMEAPGMIIVAPDAYKGAAQRLANLHTVTDGLSVAIVSPEQVYNEFSSGNPDVTAFRKMLKMWYDRAGGVQGQYTGYCLIMSRPTYDNKMNTPVVKNAGYPRVPIWQSPTGDTESSSYSTDDYVGMLADNLSDLNIGTERIHVAVGRMPVKSASEADIVMTKLENYVLNPHLGAWRNNVMIIADDQDNGVHLTQAESVWNTLRKSGNGDNFLYEKLYLDSYQMVYTSTGPTYPDAKKRMLDLIDEGVLYIDYIGHANPSTWGHEGLLYWTDITSFDNPNLPFIYAATCEFLRWDADEVSGAEILWLNPNAGVIGMICPSRSVLISANGVLNSATAQFVFEKDEEGNALRVGDIMVKGKNSGQVDSNKLRYGLIGDPAMRLPSPQYDVVVETINGINLEDDEANPEVKARSTMTIEGYVADVNGSVLEDFDGIVEIQLYDAEKVITTNGNGNDGVNSIYNDRKTRLYSGRAKAQNGRWSTVIMMPSEIENNYSPALLSLYASDGFGREGNGSCESFYVYGYDNSNNDDFEGPQFIEFYLNGPSFTDGASVSPSPLLKARVRDDSGINLSEAGIGHSMMITIDGKNHYDDVSSYYIPDTEDPCAGELTYQLENISAGDHTLTLTVWDNASNSSKATLHFTVSAAWLPEIETLYTDVNPATTSVNFIVGTDGVSGATKCRVEVYDLLGRKMWESSNIDMSSGNNLHLGWNLQDFNGARVPRGIYIYRAIVTTGSGATVTRSKKLAVAS